MKLATAFVEVRPDTKRFKADLERDVTQSASDVTKRLGSVLAGGAFLAGAKQATEVASRLQQAVGGTAAVFGEASDEVERFAKTAAESAGLSERAARELTSALGGLLKGFGFTGEEAAKLSVQLAGLGADLAATFGGTPEEAVQALGAALRGETDPLERFGIALNQTLVNQKAVELGLAASTSAVDQNAKAQATLALITERSADAQGQFGREAETAAGQAAIAAAKAENSAADLGTNLLPIYTKIAEVVGVAADAFAALPEPVQNVVIVLGAVAALSGPTKIAFEAIGSLATITRTVLSKGLDVAAKGAFDLAGNLGKAALAAAPVAVGVFAVTQALQENAAQARAAAARIDGFKDAISDAGTAAEGAATRVAALADEAPELASILAAAEVSAADLGAALVGTDDEFAAVKDQLLAAGDAAGLTDEQLALLPGSLDAMRTTAQTAATQAEELGTATAGMGEDAKGAAPKIEDLAEKLDLNEQAAKRAQESVDLFREAVDRVLRPLDRQAAQDKRTQAFIDLGKDIEARARAVDEARERLAALRAEPPESRDVEAIVEAERDLQDAIDDTSLALDGETEAAIRNRELLRELVENGISVIETAREQGESLNNLELIRENERESLRRTLEQFGFNEEAVEQYLAVLDGIPLTKETTLTVDSAKAEIQLEEAIARLQRQIDLNPLSIDVLQAEKFVVRAGDGGPRGFAAGGAVPDGLFQVHDGEIMRKHGAQVDVIAGAPTALFDGVGEQLLLEMRHQNALLAAIVRQGEGTGLDGMRRLQLELT